MDGNLIIATALCLSVGAGAMWIGTTFSKKPPQKPRGGHMREEIEIIPADVPEFKPTWKNTK